MRPAKSLHAFKTLNELTLGEVEDGWQDIDAVGTTTWHGGIAKVVVDMQGEGPYAPGVELARRITAMPGMIEALRAVAGSESIYEAQTLARDALHKAGL